MSVNPTGFCIQNRRRRSSPAFDLVLRRRPPARDWDEALSNAVRPSSIPSQTQIVTATWNLSPAHPLRLPLILMKRAFYHDIMEWPECAIALGKRALEEPGPEFASPSLDAESYKYSAEVVEFIKENPKSKGPENTFKAWFGTVSPPPPVVPHSVPAVAPNIFASPGDWGYDVHERLSLSEMMSRKKAARMRRGPVG